MAAVEAASVRVFTYPREWEIARVDAATAHFRARHPDVQVDVHAGWLVDLDVAVAGGLAPDVIIADYASIPGMVGHNYLMPVDTFLERDSEINLNTFLPTVIGLLSWQGRPAGLPINMSVLGLLYNMELFDERGVPYPDESWTWEHYVREGQKLTGDTNGDGEVDRFAIDLRWSNHSFWPAIVFQSGGRIWNDDYTRLLINSPEVARALQFLSDLVSVHHVSPRYQGGSILERELNSFAPGGLFDNRRAAMTWGGNTLVRDPGYQQRLSIGMTRLPQGPGARASLVNGDFIGMYRHTQVPELAWDFMKSVAITSAERHLMGEEPLLPVTQVGILAKLSLPQYATLPVEAMFRANADGRPNPVFHPVTRGVHDWGWSVMDSEFFTGEQIDVRPYLENLQRSLQAEVDEAIARGHSWSW